MLFSDTTPQALEALVDHLGRLKHDLGKYIGFRQRWLGEDANQAQRMEALRADLLSTRRGPEGSMNAAEVWSGFSPWVTGESEIGGRHWGFAADPDGEVLIAAMLRVQHVVTELEAGRPVDLAQAQEACRQVSSSIKSLVRRARAAR